MENLYTLRYKLHGGPKEIQFDAKTEEEARSLAKEWCDLQDFKFGSVRPFYLDMSADINRLKKDGKFKPPAAAKSPLPKL